MVTLTERATQEVKRLLEKDARPGVGLRVGVKGGGCSGLSYVLGFDTGKGEFDQEFEQNGVKVLIDAKSLLYLDGIEVDYKDGLTGAGFTFNNPNAKRSCGCGSSFSA